MEGAFGKFRHIHPSLIVAAGITAADLVDKHHILHQHPSARDKVLQGVIQAVLHRIHALLTNGGVEHGLCAVLVHESHPFTGGYHTVGMGGKSLGGSKLITRLETFAFGERDVLGAPVLVGHRHTLLDPRTGHVDVDHGFPDVSPQLYGQLAVADFDIALGEMQGLTEVLHVETWRQTQPEAPGLQQGVILVERAATGYIEQHVALLDPYVHADVATSAGHRL